MNNEETKILNVSIEGTGGSCSQSVKSLQNGKYRIERILGQGGFGITYLATDVTLNRKVAIKEFFLKEFCLRNTMASVFVSNPTNSEFVERYLSKFLKEARTLANLRHENIIQVYEFFEENNTAYYVMEYIEGETLQEIVTRKGKLVEQEALGYMNQVAEALEYIHSLRINHLDVKPANIMVRKSDGRAVLIDFGGAKQYDTRGDQTSTTPVGISHGYAPMEQYNAGGVSTFSPQTDIYSLGATLYKLITGINPPQASDVLNEGLPELPAHISNAVKDTITASMQVRKNDRPTDINSALYLLKEGTFSNADSKAKLAEDKTATKNEPIDEETKITASSSKEDTPKKTKETTSQSKPDEAKTSFWKKTIVKIFIGCVVFSILFLIFNNMNYIGNTIETNSNYSSNTSYWEPVDTVEIKTTNIEFETTKYGINKTEDDFIFSVQVDYPVKGNPFLVSNIKEWIVDVIDNEYNGDLDNINFILEQASIKHKKDKDPGYQTERTLNINIENKTQKYITYYCEDYVYHGGAHGGEKRIGATFSIDDGEKFGWNMINRTQSLRELLIDELKYQYFVELNDDVFFERIMLVNVIPSRYNFPFPETEPWVSNKGIVFQYQEYEISSYGEGRPVCIIPFHKMKPYLKQSAIKMLEK